MDRVGLVALLLALALAVAGGGVWLRGSKVTSASAGLDGTDPCQRYRRGTAAEVFIKADNSRDHVICENLVAAGFLPEDVHNRYFLLRGSATSAELFRRGDGRWVAAICGRLEDLYTYDSFRAANNLSPFAWNELAQGCSRRPPRNNDATVTDSRQCRYRRATPSELPAPVEQGCR